MLFKKSCIAGGATVKWKRKFRGEEFGENSDEPKPEGAVEVQNTPPESWHALDAEACMRRRGCNCEPLTAFERCAAKSVGSRKGATITNASAELYGISVNPTELTQGSTGPRKPQRNRRRKKLDPKNYEAKKPKAKRSDLEKTSHLTLKKSKRNSGGGEA